MAPHDDASADKENSDVPTSPPPSVATRQTRAKKVHVISDSDNEANTTRSVRHKGPPAKKKNPKKKTASPQSDYEDDQPPTPKKGKRKGKAPAASEPNKTPKPITKAAADAATKAMAQLAINLSIDSARKESDLRKRAEAEQQLAHYQATALERAVAYAEKRLQALQIAKDLNLDPKLVGLPEDPLTISPPSKNTVPATASASSTTPPARTTASSESPTSTTPPAPNESPSISTSSSISPQTPVVYATPFSTGFGAFTPVTPFGVQGAFAGHPSPSFSNMPFTGFSATPFAQPTAFAQPHPFAQGHAQSNTSASRAPVYTTAEPGPEVTMSDM